MPSFWLPTRRPALTWLPVACCLAAIVLLPVRPPVEQSIVEAVNAQRRAHGLAALSFDARLAQAAAVHARDLAHRGRLDHRGSDGSDAGERANRAGYRWSVIAENLALTSASSPRGVVGLWMRSPGHRRNLLNQQVTEMGAAHVRHTWVLVLARPAGRR